jgi:hypothetical protein
LENPTIDPKLLILWTPKDAYIIPIQSMDL